MGRERAEFDLREYFKAAYEKSTTEEEKKPPIIIQNDMSYVKRSYNWLSRWGILPRPGGLDNQYLSWVQDMEQMSALDKEIADEWIAFNKPKEENGSAQDW